MPSIDETEARILLGAIRTHRALRPALLDLLAEDPDCIVPADPFGRISSEPPVQGSGIPAHQDRLLAALFENNPDIEMPANPVAPLTPFQPIVGSGIPASELLLRDRR